MFETKDIDDRYLIALDLDGTLLNNEKNILPLTKEYLIELTRRGHKIVLVSGRSKHNINRYYKELGLNTPIIALNGAHVIYPSFEGKNDLIYPIPKSVIKKFIDKFDENSFVNIMGESKYNSYFLKENHIFPFFFDPGDLNVHIGSFKDLNEDLLTIIIQSSDTKRNKAMLKFFEEEKCGFSIRFWHDIPVFGEFYHFNINKGTSLLKVADIYKIKRDNIIAFGDAPNDLDMLSVAKYSYAMQNAHQSVKDIAKNTTLYDNDNEGIYYALKDFFDSDLEEKDV